MNFEELKKNYLQTLENTQSQLEILNSFTNAHLFQQNELQELLNIKEQVANCYEKIKKSEIEVAIIGAENGGKSTFANAFVKLKEAFPTGSTRTTYTSTKLKYGNDRAVVIFYTTEEFDEIFNELLEQVKYQNRNGLKNFDVNDYQKYFESLKQKDKKLYEDTFSTINKDILKIANGRKTIIQNLNQTPKYFDKTQIENQELRDFITHEHIARSVKNIDIELSSFEDTKEMVLYDVPGFDSLTEKHKIETKKALNMADAIILIKNIIENPNIRSHETDILKSYDENGLPLYEKLFAFGTQIDRANDIDDAKTNAPTFTKELKENLNMKENRIFYGSPYAYLEQIGLYKTNHSIEKMKKLKLEQYINSIDKIREAIKEFYKNEAFNNLKKQIDNLIQKLKNIIQNKISKKDEIKQQLSLLDKEMANRSIDIFNRVLSDLEKVLADLQEELENDILKEKPFSQKLEQDIDAITTNIDKEEIAEINKKVSLGEINAERPEAVNKEIRKQLSPKIKKEFINKALNIATEKYEIYLNKMLEKVLNEVLKTDDEKIKDKLKEFILNYESEIQYKKESFLFLIEKFSEAVITTMIKNSKGSQDRENTFNKYEDDLYSLAIYYEDKKELNNKSLNDLELIQKILGHQNNNKSIHNLKSQNRETGRAKSNDEVIKEINDDLNSLKDILKKAVIKAISLERPFVSTFSKQFKFLTQARDEWKNFIIDNLEYFITENDIESKKQQLQKELTLLNNLENILKKL